MEAKNQRKPERHGIKYALATKGQGMLLHFEAWIQFFSLSVRESIGEYTTIGEMKVGNTPLLDKMPPKVIELWKKYSRNNPPRSIYFINKIKRIFEK